MEVETPEGHRCIYLTREPGSSKFSLQTVKSGVACGDDKLYDVNDGGIQHPGLDGATADALYDAAYKACYGPTYIAPSEAGDRAARRNPAYRADAERGCRNANLDIEACIPPIYYTYGDPYYCDDGNGRYLKQP